MKHDSLITPRPRYAGFWRRCASLFIDGIIVGALSWLAIAIIVPGGNGHIGEVVSAGAAAQQTGIQLIVALAYFASLESSAHSATLGKRVMGIKVTDISGLRISFGRALVRHIFRALSVMLLFFGYFMALFTKRKQTLHDVIARTVVIKA